MRGFKPFVLGMFVLSMGVSPALAQKEPPVKTPQFDVEPKADQLLRKMSDFLGGTKKFQVSTEYVYEVVLKDGAKLQTLGQSDVTVDRANGLRANRKGEVVDASFYYDGKNISIYGRNSGFYATTTAPTNLDAAIDFARDRLNLEAPGADLLYSNAYRVMMEDVVSGTYIAKAVIDGKPAHHLAFRGREVDWQIWIADGPQPLPLRYVITSKLVKSAPEFEVTLANWNLAPKISRQDFVFVPPAGAERIEFLGLAKPRASRKEG